MVFLTNECKCVIQHLSHPATILKLVIKSLGNFSKKIRYFEMSGQYLVSQVRYPITTIN